MFNRKLLQVTALATSAVVLSPVASLAAQYDALCGGDRDCKISISPQGVSGPQGFMPTGGIVQWYQGGEGDKHATGAAVAGGVAGGVGGALVGAAATCWTIILCPVGFFGGMALGGGLGAGAGKSSDHMFTVIGYNQEGRKIAQSFRFINKKPARRVAMELPVMTGLAMGQVRPLETIAKALGVELQDPAPAAVSASALPTNIGPAAVAAKPKPAKKCWSAYLKGNPAMAKWAEANPALAAQNKKRFDDC